jgi:membrane-bound ClpP family serine protease
MISIKISLIVFACIFGGAVLGILLHAVLPQHHLSAESKDIVKLGMGLVGTVAALVLGLLVASAKSSYDTQSAEMTQLTANVALLDRILAHYGPETKESRDRLRETVTRAVSQIWVEDGASAGSGSPQSAGGEVLYDKIQALSPKNDAQRSLKSQALSIVMETGKLRQLMFTQGTTAVSTPLLVVLVLWLSVIFISFGLFAPFNATVVSSLFVSALSVSGAIFLILDMYTPYTGVIGISSAPLYIALGQLGQ